MIHQKEFAYQPHESECERASNGYLMSLVALIVGLPLPIVNLIATGIFWMGNKKASYFVRFHCTQAMLAQFGLFFTNSFGFWWTFGVVFGDDSLNSQYIAYIILLFILNISEFIFTIYSAIQVRKGIHLEWWIYGPLSHLLVDEQKNSNPLNN